MQDEKILKENYEFFVSIKQSLLDDVSKKDKFIVIHDKEIKGSFDSFETAYIWAKAQFTDENFLIQQAINESDVTNFVCGAICQ
ncbi:MAG TPA: hypothetical protein VLX68_10650 [Chitinivibrionales bacterium]|nr:hypothetical protein [Chitinivibrionales bacterium]